MTTPTITIFGASGFIGRYLVQRMARAGWLIRAVGRRPEHGFYLKTLGDVGQITPLGVALSDRAAVAAAVAGADAVVNLVGILYSRGARTFEAIHHQGARHVAEAAAAAKVGRLLHMSALGADPASGSRYAVSKAAGEAAVRAAFPAATIFRPSVVFGPEDDFLNRFGRMATRLPALPLIGGGTTRFQPVYVDDVAQAMASVVERPASQGTTYELGGPRVYTFKELMEFLLATIGRKRWLVPLSFELAALQARVLECLPVPPLTRDQVALLRTDNVVSGNFPGLGDLGLAATALELIAPTYLDQYRPGGRFPARQKARK